MPYDQEHTGLSDAISFSRLLDLFSTDQNTGYNLPFTKEKRHYSIKNQVSALYVNVFSETSRTSVISTFFRLIFRTFSQSIQNIHMPRLR